MAGPYEFDTEPGTADACSTLVDSLPDQVADLSSDPVDSTRVAAWGDPRVVLRCGVTPPADLRPESRCDDVDGVGWFTEEQDDSTVFTTIGRSPLVSVTVPGDYDPAGAALIDLADAITAGTTVESPCV